MPYNIKKWYYIDLFNSHKKSTIPILQMNWDLHKCLTQGKRQNQEISWSSWDSFLQNWQQNWNKKNKNHYKTPMGPFSPTKQSKVEAVLENSNMDIWINNFTLLSHNEES
jgi:hypothetical protein